MRRGFLLLVAAVMLAGCGGGGTVQHGVLSPGLQVAYGGTSMNTGLASFKAAYGGSDGYSVPGYFETHYCEWSLVRQDGPSPNVSDVSTQTVTAGRYIWLEYLFRAQEPGSHEYTCTLTVHQTQDPKSPTLEQAQATGLFTTGIH
jgi:hypothetical protein